MPYILYIASSRIHRTLTTSTTVYTRKHNQIHLSLCLEEYWTPHLWFQVLKKKKKKLSSFQSEPELTQISLEGEQGTNYEDQLSNKMGEGLFKPHGLYFSANVTDTTQISQSEVNQMESRGSTTGSGN